LAVTDLDEARLQASGGGTEAFYVDERSPWLFNARRQ
jgi:hypothetical protein